MNLKACITSYIYLIKIDEIDYKESHLLRVESVKAFNGRDIYVIPSDYQTCDIAANEKEGRELLRKKYNAIVDLARKGAETEKLKLIGDLESAQGADGFSMARKKRIEDELDLLSKREVELMTIALYRFKEYVFSARNLKGYTFDGGN